MTECRLTILEAGHCVHPQHVVERNFRVRTMQFPALFALIEHPQRGPILFDTGYSQPFLDAVSEWPARIYGWVTPTRIDPSEFAAAQLARRGIDPRDVSLVICSHFHADHVAGLADFERAEFLYFASAWEAVRKLTGFAGVRRGFLPQLIPSDFERRSRSIEEQDWTPLGPRWAPFRSGCDLLGDGSLTAVALPGHAAGQIGLIVRCEGGDEAFLVADACWTSRAFRETRMPSAVTRLLFDDMGQYRETLGWIGALHRGRPELPILPSHCCEVRAGWVRGDGGRPA